MSLAKCCDCGAAFDRDDDEAWKVRCLPCWARRKGGDNPRRPSSGSASGGRVDPIWRELAGQMRALLNLCHPDRHGGSPLATSTTQWLLSVRDRLEHHIGATR